MDDFNEYMLENLKTQRLEYHDTITAARKSANKMQVFAIYGVNKNDDGEQYIFIENDLIRKYAKDGKEKND